MKFLLFLALLFIGASCMKQRGYDPNEFIERTVISEKPIEFSLHRIETSRFAGQIHYSATKRRTNAGRGEPSFWEYEDVVIKFPGLTETQFNFLKMEYGDNTSQVVFEQGQTYEIADFLPPPIQALHKMQWFGLPNQETTNCWSTAYEVANYANNQFAVFIASPIEMMSTLQDPRYASQLANGERLRSGDIVLDYWTNDAFISPNIGHAVIYIDENLYFEKSGIGNTPFGIATDSYRLAKNTVSDGQYFFRFKKGAPPPGKAHFSGINSRFRPKPGIPIPTTIYEIVYDKNGRARFSSGILPQSTFAKSSIADYELQFVIPPLDASNQAEFERLRSTKPACLVRAYKLITDFVWSFNVATSKKLDCDIKRYLNDNTTYAIEGMCVGHDGVLISDEDMTTQLEEQLASERFTYTRTDAKSFNFRIERECKN